MTPFTAAYIRLVPITNGLFTPLTGVGQIVQLALPDDLPFSELNAAAAYANAAATFPVNPPALTMFDGGLSWSAAAVVSLASHLHEDATDNSKISR